MMEKTRDEQSKREVILLAAVEVFSENGFHDARVEEIARRAGIGKGTVYQYFSTKKHLFQEVLREGMEYYEQEIHREQSSSDALEVRLERIASLQLTFATTHKNMAKVMMNNPESVSEKAREIFIAVRDGIHKELVRLFYEAAARGEIPEGDFDTGAWILLGGLNAIATTAILNEGDLDLSDRAHSFIKLFMYGLANRNPGTTGGAYS